MLFGESCINFKKLFLKTNKVSELRILKCSLFHLNIVKRKKGFLKNAFLAMY